jgi:hypothetical protein
MKCNYKCYHHIDESPISDGWNVNNHSYDINVDYWHINDIRLGTSM